MTTDLAFDFIVDKENNSVKVKREFDAELPLVWDAYTKSELLDQWWAPKPWKARTVKMDFRPGGEWRYFMEGPEAEQHACLVQYKDVDFQKRFSGTDAFADKEFNVNSEMPKSEWELSFSAAGSRTVVDVNISFEKLADLESYIQMGFREGFTAALGNLDELLPTLNR